MAQKLPWAFFVAAPCRTGSTRGHVTVLPLRFSPGVATPEQSGGGRLESVATADYTAAARLPQKVLSFPPAPPFPFPKLFMFAFSFCDFRKKEKAGH